MSHAIIIREFGGPEVLKWEPFDPGPPQPGEVLIRHEAVGLNYIDVYHRTGFYPPGDLPVVLGMEAAGRIEALGDGVSGFDVGDRVAYASPPVGAYAEIRRMPADRVIPLPDAVSSPHAAAMMLQGMTARYLLHGAYPVKGGDWILIQAAAGGVGLIVCQWAKYKGVNVIGTVGSPEKADLARAYGCDYPILYDSEDFTERVSDITDGRGVDVVYDSVGKSTFMKSLDCLRPMGMLVSFGQSSGPVPPIDISVLSAKGSLFLTRPSLMTYTAKREDLLEHAEDLFEMIARGVVKVDIRQTYPLKDAEQAHRDLEARKTKGSTVFEI